MVRKLEARAQFQATLLMKVPDCGEWEPRRAPRTAHCRLVPLDGLLAASCSAVVAYSVEEKGLGMPPCHHFLQRAA